ncbi:hypothetical protein SAMN04487830_102142 [Pseudobutyrivibrio sp. OR37]|uniref:hypothetical protein n=1 Tax=Pseudobutyrivibrio sp. OR37 TaxID=1798186 RepID=UPI0008DF5A01|nr:hypothetical protein [Pseudobutyrivibrio sp. OR37]SFH58299.1 hypothetical protein SAMN04487830_102142 [Pseudobutyrivibrio sp. OR37]
MTKKEMAVVVEAYEGLREAMEIISDLFDLGHSIVTLTTDSPFGKIDKLLDLFYGYIPAAHEDLEVEERMYHILLHDKWLTTDEKIEAIENLRKECKGKKRK